MEKVKIFLCDLTYTQQGIVAEFVPYGIGCLKSYFLKHSRNADKCDIALFKYPESFIERFSKDNPEIVGFSNYIWNPDLSYGLAEEIKRRNPGTFIIFGGPNYPLEYDERMKWLKKRPAIDMYIVGEAEEQFKRAVDTWFLSRDIDKVKQAGLDGCHALIKRSVLKASDAIPRLDDLDFPSPYLGGYLDEFLEDKRLIPLTQTNRGCPFTCTFCEKGSSTWTKMSYKSMRVFEEEITYIAKKSRQKKLALADNNFGMWPQDVEMSRIIAGVKDRFDYPYHIVAATGKNVEERILKCVEILKGSLPVTASVQSLDPEVLKNVKRSNVSVKTLMNIAKAADSVHTSTRSEIILALPGDTKKKHIDTILQLIEMKMQFVLPFTLILLDGSELATQESRKRWDMKTKFRLNHGCFGVYKFGNKDIRSTEIEEVVVGLDTLSFQDYLDCRVFDLTISIFFSDDILYELTSFLSHFGIKASDFIMFIHDNRGKYFTQGINKLYDSYITATKNELWDSKEELKSYLETLATIEGDDKVVGYNILFRHRAIALTSLVDEIVDAAFNAASALIGPDRLAEHASYLNELKSFIKLRKRNLFDYINISRQSFSYDFYELAENNFTGMPRRSDKAVKIKFYHNENQRKLFEGFTHDLAGAMRILPRLSLVKIYRSMERENV